MSHHVRMLAAIAAIGSYCAASASLAQTHAMPPSMLTPPATAVAPGYPNPGIAPVGAPGLPPGGAEFGLREPPAAPIAPGTVAGSAAAFNEPAPPVGLPGVPYYENTCWDWQLLPEGLMYKSYLAGGREPRLGTQLTYQRNFGWVWDSTLGARVGLLRYGTDDPLVPEGWQIDTEGAAFPRLDAERTRDLVTSDFRFGFLLTGRRGPWEIKAGYYHLSSHMGDEYLLHVPGAVRINYVRDCLITGLALRPHPDWRLYAEIGYAVYIDSGAEPWEFQFGTEFSPAAATTAWGAPFVAANGHLRQENDFGGNVTVQAGWQWRGRTGNLFRIGAHYFNGMSDQYQFFRQFEEQIGVGFWYDF